KNGGETSSHDRRDSGAQRKERVKRRRAALARAGRRSDTLVSDQAWAAASCSATFVAGVAVTWAIVEPAFARTWIATLSPTFRPGRSVTVGTFTCQSRY